MPDSFELPWLWSAVIKLMRRKRFAGFSRCVVNKLIAFTFRHPVGRSSRLACRRSGLEPRLTTVVRALNDLAKPTAGLRRVNAVRIHRGSFDVIHLPTGKMRATHIPLFAFSI